MNNKKLTLTGTNIMFLIFTVVFIFYQMVIGVILGERLNDYIYMIVIINEFVMILGSVLIYCLIAKINIKEAFRFNKPPLVPMLLIVLASVPAYFVASMLNNVLVYFLQFIGNIPAQSIPVPQNIPELAVGILIIAVAPGICEEIMHRGLLLRAYEKRGSYKAVVIVSIFFGIFHFDITNFFGPVFLGLIIGYYVVRTNSIYAGILAHFLNNTIAEILQYSFGEQATSDIITISWPDLQSVLFFGAAGLIGTALVLFFFKKSTEGKAVITPPIDRVSRDIKSVLSHWPVILVLVIYFFMTLLSLFMYIWLKYMNNL
ncbi:MAG: type II CAAX endopeptidase family protein [Clostridiaceae bacterium]